MKAIRTLLIALAFMMILFSIAPQPVLNPTTMILAPHQGSVTATDGDSSPSSIISFSQTETGDAGSFWPDGYNNSVTNSYDRYNMAGIGNWVSYGLGAGESKGTTGDYAYIRCKAIGSDDWSGMYSNRPSFTAASLGKIYLEIRYKGNCVGQAVWRILGYTADATGGTGWVIASLTQTTTWTTYRAILPTTNALESICLVVEILTAQPAVEIDYDYVNIVPCTNSGWQNDCSATGNTSFFGSGASLTSDADKFRLYTNAIFSAYFYFYFDVTTGGAGLNSSIYPFLEIRTTGETGGSGSSNISLLYDTSSVLVLSNSFAYLFGPSHYYNLREAGNYAYNGIKIGLPSATTLFIDWMCVYTIANFTTTFTVNPPFGQGVDVAYTLSGLLYATKSYYTCAFVFDYDPPISVASASYSRWNISTSKNWQIGISTYVSSWLTRNYDTTWGLAAGTTTDVKLLGYPDNSGPMIVSAVKFLADTSIPQVSWSTIAPINPTVNQTFAMYALVTETYTLYEVFFRAIVSPVGYMVTDYSASYKGSNLWLYSVAKLSIPGDYLFRVIGTDGANNSTLGAAVYLAVTISNSTLTITNRLAIPQENIVSFSGTASLPCKVNITEGGVLRGTATIPQAGEFGLWWNVSIAATGTIVASLFFYTTGITPSSNVTVHVTYTKVIPISASIQPILDAVTNAIASIINSMPDSPQPIQVITGDIWLLIFKVLVAGVIILILAIILVTVIRALGNDRATRSKEGKPNATNSPTVYKID